MLEDKTFKQNNVQITMRQLVNNPRWFSVIFRYAGISLSEENKNYPTGSLQHFLRQYVWQNILKQADSRGSALTRGSTFAKGSAHK